nr:polysaccharide deacetylase family protein [Pseudenhygromyxa sp. WMMC2535]
MTFDNGPHPEVTPRVLDVLDAHAIHATFFVLGKHLATAEGMAMAEATRDRGHRLGNHSFSHEVPLGEDLGPAAVARELEGTQRLLDEVWRGPRWFRPFGGGGKLGPHLLSPDSVEWLVAGKHTCVLWNSVPGDWLDAEGWVERALADAARLEHAVIVLHDILPEAMTRLDEFICRLREAGHRFGDDFPAACLPIVEGAPRAGLEAFVRAAE